MEIKFVRPLNTFIHFSYVSKNAQSQNYFLFLKFFYKLYAEAYDDGVQNCYWRLYDKQPNSCNL